MKCVMVVDACLPLGLMANTVAVLAISIGYKVNGIVVEDVADRDGTIHAGITEATVPLLKGDSSLIRSLREKLLAMPDHSLYYVDFCDVAQKAKRYADYKNTLAETPADDLIYLGIAIYGEDKEVNKLTGNIGLLR